MKIKIQLLLHYFWDSPGLGFRVKTKTKCYGFVLKIPYRLAILLNDIGLK